MTKLPYSTVNRIIKDAGVPRVRKGVTEVVIDHAVKYIEELVQAAYVLSEHSKHISLREEDIEAVIQLRNNKLFEK